MNQKELYIQYLEDALNHAKTGEPMKKWQVKDGNGWWEDRQYLIRDNLEKMRSGLLSIRIKPEPFKWTTYAYRGQLGIYTSAIPNHLTVKEVSLMEMVTEQNILAVYHHEIEPE